MNNTRQFLCRLLKEIPFVGTAAFLHSLQSVLKFLPIWCRGLYWESARTRSPARCVGIARLIHSYAEAEVRPGAAQVGRID